MIMMKSVDDNNGTVILDVLQTDTKYNQADLNNAYYHLMISDWGKLIVNDLMNQFDPLAELHVPNDPHTTAYNNGTVAPIKYMLLNIKKMKFKPGNINTADTTDDIS